MSHAAATTARIEAKRSDVGVGSEQNGAAYRLLSVLAHMTDSIHKSGERPSTSRSPEILLAEDDDDTRMIIATALRREGYDVIEVKSGAELLEHVGATLLFREVSPPPDLIVSDIRMPGFTGTGVLEGLRDADIDMPFILMTAHGGAEAKRLSESLGADALFLKPFDISEFLATVRSLLPSEAWEKRESTQSRRGPHDTDISDLLGTDTTGQPRR